MKLWIDAQLSPAIAAWLNRTFDDIEAESIRALGLRNATDLEIFKAANIADVVVLSKDDDFIQLIEQKGTPPKQLWVTCGNTSNAKMKKILSSVLPKAKKLIKSGENIVEISDKVG